MTVWPSERGWMPEVAGLVGDPAENRSSKERTDLSLRTGCSGSDAAASGASRSAIQAAAPEATATATRNPSIHSDDGTFLRRDRGPSAITVACAIHPPSRRLDRSPPPQGFAEKQAPQSEPNRSNIDAKARPRPLTAEDERDNPKKLSDCSDFAADRS